VANHKRSLERAKASSRLNVKLGEATDESYRNSFSSGAQINQTIFDGGRWWNQIKQSNATYRSSEHGYNATKESVIATVTQWYYSLLKSIKLQEVYEKAVPHVQDETMKNLLRHENAENYWD